MNRMKKWFIGDYLSKTNDVFERSKIELLYSYSIAFWILGTIFYITLFFKGLWYHVGIISFAVVALAMIPFILKYTQNVKRASNWYIFQQILVSSVSIVLQEGKNGINSAYWTILFFLFAFFLYGKKWGAVMILIMLVTSSIASFITTLVEIPVEQQLPDTPEVFFLPLLLNIYVVYMFVKTRGDAEVHIKTQQLKLEHSKKELEIVNKDITDSIQYANKIQKAVLPHEETIQRNIPLYFIYYKPKAIVSGDFYWFHEIDKDNYIYVNADCTGHGVPGAFMTVIASNLLNQTVIDNKIYQPSLILQEVDRLLNMTLKQDSERFHNVQDGMDLTLVKVNKAKREVVITSAKRPVVYIRNKQFLEIKANKFSIGGMRTEMKVFEEVKIECQQDDMMYLFTDGYHDQFGGPKGKKYSSKKLKEKFMEIHMKGISEQKSELDAAMRSWKGDLEQIDDICVTGIRF